MNQSNDLDINRHIRKVLVKHWVDLGRLSIRTTKGKISIHGFLDRISGTQERLSSSIVKGMFDEIERIGGVERLTVELVNWTSSDGTWMPLDRGKKMAGGDAHAAESRQTSYDIR
jgi:hypothetical protein